MQASEQPLRPDARVRLEEIAAELGMEAGRWQLRLEFQDGRLRWYETSRVRAPASELERPGRRDRGPLPAADPGNSG